MTLQQAMESYEKLSLRKLAEALGVNYNMLLKASKQPIVGMPYDPTATNYEAVEAYIAKKNPDGVDYEALADMDLNTIVKLPFEPNVGQLLTLRQDAVDTIYQVIWVTPTHIVIQGQNSTQPRVFSNATFMHQGPKAYEAPAPTAEVATEEKSAVDEGSSKKSRKSRVASSNE